MVNEVTKYCKCKEKTMVIYVPKELDHYHAEMVRAEAEAIFMKMPIKNIIFDFSDTVFMDSSGIGLVTGRYRKICDIGGVLYVYGLSKAMDKVFMLSGLNRIVTKIQKMEEGIYE